MKVGPCVAFITGSLGLLAAPAFADPVVPGVTPVYPSSTAASEVRLTPEQVRKVLDEASKGAEPIPVGKASIAEEKPCPTKAHGEMGMEAGTGGYGAMYGAAVVPLGCHGSVAIAIGTGTGGGEYRRRR